MAAQGSSHSFFKECTRVGGTSLYVTGHRLIQLSDFSRVRSGQGSVCQTRVSPDIDLRSSRYISVSWRSTTGSGHGVKDLRVGSGHRSMAYFRSGFNSSVKGLTCELCRLRSASSSSSSRLQLYRFISHKTAQRIIYKRKIKKRSTLY